jgi:hypothetical protein
LKLADAAKNIATLGYSSYRKSLQLEAQLKSLRDQSATGQTIASSQGNIAVVRSAPPQFFRKQNVMMLRNYSQYNPWIRGAINIHRRSISRAKPEIVPFDKDRPMDKGVESSLKAILNGTNRKGKPYSQAKAEFIDDYMTIGHGVYRKVINRALQPIEIDSFDAARLGFIPNWDGDPTKPRYVEFTGNNYDIQKYILDPFCSVLMDVSFSYDTLGLSRVETLDSTIRALLGGDDYLANQIMNPMPNGLLNLGKGVGQGQVAETRQQMDAVRRAFIITGGTDQAQWMPFTANAKDQQLIEAMILFIRQVCLIFNVSTSSMRLEMDLSRANAETMATEEDIGVMEVLGAVEDFENAQFTSRFGPMEVHNCMISYPILNQLDAAREADISAKSLAGGSWITINEARAKSGQKPLESPLADEVFIDPTKMPMSIMEAKIRADNTMGVIGQLPAGGTE